MQHLAQAPPTTKGWRSHYWKAWLEGLDLYDDVDDDFEVMVAVDEGVLRGRQLHGRSVGGGLREDDGVAGQSLLLVGRFGRVALVSSSNGQRTLTSSLPSKLDEDEAARDLSSCH